EHGGASGRGVGEVIAMPHEELRDGRLIAFRRAVSPQPSLLQGRGGDDERVADVFAVGEATKRMRRPGRWMRPAVHPDHAMAFGNLRPPVNGDETLRMRIPFLPCAEVTSGAHLVRRDV